MMMMMMMMLTMMTTMMLIVMVVRTVQVREDVHCFVDAPLHFCFCNDDEMVIA